MAARRFDWLELRPEGLYCRPADLYVDPSRAVPRAVVTHGHSDHARPGHGAVLATAETQAIMGVRMAEDRPRRQSLAGPGVRPGPVVRSNRASAPTLPI